MVNPLLSDLISLVCSRSGDFNVPIINILKMISKEQGEFVPSHPDSLTCSDKSSLYDRSDALNLCPGLTYSIKRAIRGCASGKENSRLACSLLLSAIVGTFGSVLSAEILFNWTVVLLNPQVVGIGKAKADQRMTYMGKLAVYTALLKCDIFFGFDEVTCRILQDLVDIRSKKSFFALLVDTIILDFILLHEDPLRIQFSKFILQNIKSRAFLLESALSCLIGSPLLVPNISNDSREIIDFLPNLHPALRIISRESFESISSQVDTLLSSHSQELKLVAVLILAEAQRIEPPMSFWELARTLDSKKRFKENIDGSLKSKASFIIDKYIDEIRKMDAVELFKRLSVIPLYVIKKLPLDAFGSLQDDDFVNLFKKISEFSGTRKAECLFLLLRNRELSGKVCEILATTLCSHSEDSEFSSLFKKKFASLMISIKSPQLRVLLAAISHSFEEANCELMGGPIYELLKTFKKLSKSQDSLFSVASSIVICVSAISEEAGCFELMDELKGFHKKRDSVDPEERSLFWSETIICLLSMEQAYIRKLAELLFLDAAKTGSLTITGVEPLLELIEKKLSTTNFDMDNDSSEEFEEEANQDYHAVQPDHEACDLDDDQMEEFDGELAAAVAMHINSSISKKSEKKRLEVAGTVIQFKALSLMDLFGRSKEVPLPLKFAILPRLLRCLQLIELRGKDCNELAAKLLKIIKILLDSCRTEASYDWLALAGFALALNTKKENLCHAIAAIISIGFKTGNDMDGLIETLFTDSLLCGEKLHEVSKIIMFLTNYNMSQYITDRFSQILPARFPSDIRCFSKSAFIRSLRVAVSHSTNIEKTVSFVFGLLYEEFLENANKDTSRSSWLRSQLSDLHSWFKLDPSQEKLHKWMMIRTQITDIKLIGQIDLAISSVNQNH